MKKITSFQNVLFTVIAFCSTICMDGCNKSASITTPAPPGNEFLTTVKLVYVNSSNASDSGHAIWRQLDPNGAALPDTSLAFLNLKANSTYNVNVVLLDETKSPPDIVSDEVKVRENYHLFFFQPTPTSASNLVISNTTPYIPTSDGTVTNATGPYLNLAVNRTDLDTNTPPLQIGLTDNFVTGAASNGWLRVVLRHQPNAKNGTYDPGSTDLDMNYKITIK